MEILKELIKNYKEFDPECFPEIVLSQGCIKFITTISEEDKEDSNSNK